MARCAGSFRTVRRMGGIWRGLSTEIRNSYCGMRNVECGN
jgi:hypothetical protein